MSSEAGPAAVRGDAAPRRTRSAKHQFTSTMLVLEAFVVLFASLAAYALREAPPAVVWGAGGALMVALVAVSGMLRWPGGYVAGSALQVAVLATGFVVPTMFVVGGIFVVLWVASLRLGARIDRERVEREGHGIPSDRTSGGAGEPAPGR